MLYTIKSGAMATTASFVKLTTGTSIRTMLQLKPFNVMKIAAWGISFDGSAAATPGTVELLDTGTIFCTGLTACADADIDKVSGRDQANASVAGLTLATTGTGFTNGANTEGSIVASTTYDVQLLPPTAPYILQFPLDARPLCIIGNAVRVRVNFAAAINCITWITVDI
jgi:hypothetical protein